MFLLSKSSTWEISNQHIQNTFGWGQRKVWQKLNELVKAHYLVILKDRDKGQFTKVSYTVYPIPYEEDSHNAQNRNAAHRNAVRETLENTDTTIEEKEEKNYIKDFEELKETYRKVGNTKDIIGSMNKAETKYISLLSKKEVKHDTVISSLIAYDKHLKKSTFQSKQHLITFLNQKSWETYTFTEEKILTLHEAREQSYRNTGFWKDEWGNKPVGDNK